MGKSDVLVKAMLDFLSQHPDKGCVVYCTTKLPPLDILYIHNHTKGLASGLTLDYLTNNDGIR